MGESSSSSSSSSSQSFFKKHYEGVKEFWTERFSFLENYGRFVQREKPLPSWSDSDVEEFIASDPVNGFTLKTAREAVNFGLTGSVIGAVSTAGVAWKYSRSLHGAGLSFLAGGVFGWTFGQEVANHWLQLYRLDTMAAQVKFMEWWEKKSEGQS
ncbi:succinate dehydrogenase subunit 6, mitochondrial [Quercus robur]|uniref:succinate dehydrogenase subunit 6, mitochondrial n=1 Tax=Quercus robur TaxID=38942 RepID=UPI002161A0E7|nr:succinate dehydrogenase subunit 6, mitochondrial [Quercus robur]